MTNVLRYIFVIVIAYSVAMVVPICIDIIDDYKSSFWLTIKEFIKEVLSIVKFRKQPIQKRILLIILTVLCIPMWTMTILFVMIYFLFIPVDKFINKYINQFCDYLFDENKDANKNISIIYPRMDFIRKNPFRLKYGAISDTIKVYRIDKITGCIVDEISDYNYNDKLRLLYIHNFMDEHTNYNIFVKYNVLISKSSLREHKNIFDD